MICAIDPLRENKPVINAKKIVAGTSEHPRSLTTWTRTSGDETTTQKPRTAENQMKACTLNSGRVENNSASTGSGKADAFLPNQRSRQLHNRTRPAGMAKSIPR